MPCIKIPNGIICVSNEAQLHVGKKYIFMSYHEYCGPAFYTDRAQTKEYEPKDENDPVWPVFQEWLDKYTAKKLENEQKRKTSCQKPKSLQSRLPTENVTKMVKL